MKFTDIAAEIEKILYLLKLKKVTRWGFERPDNDPTESVAEHIYGLMVLAKYFLPLLDPERELDWQQIYDMILWHDTGEIETGDIPTFQKTQAHTDAEIKALEEVKKQSPTHLVDEVYEAAIRYESSVGPEVEFMKMIDKMEGAFSLFANPVVAQERFAKQQVTQEMFINKRGFIKDTHPAVFEFVLTMANEMEKQDLFYTK